MSDKISLQEIIENVLADNGIDYESINDSNVRRLRRTFDRLIERLGSDKEILKDKDGNFLFRKSDKSFMKNLINQLNDDDSSIAKFTKGRTSEINFSPNEVRKLIQSILDEADKNELEQIAFFFSGIFLYSPLRSKQDCHDLIDCLSLSMSDQSIYLGKIEHILKKEFALRIAEATLHILAIAKGLDYADGDIGNHYYYERNPEIRFEYAERDKRVLKKIQEDDDLRLYIEKNLGEKRKIFSIIPLSKIKINKY